MIELFSGSSHGDIELREYVQNTAYVESFSGIVAHLTKKENKTITQDQWQQYFTKDVWLIILAELNLANLASCMQVCKFLQKINYRISQV